MVELKGASVKTIVVELVLYALGFYLALTVADAIKKTLDRYVSNEGDEVRTSWISVAIALAIIVISVYIIMRYIVKNKSTNTTL